MDETIADLEAERAYLNDALYGPRMAGISADYAYSRYCELGRIIDEMMKEVAK